MYIALMFDWDNGKEKVNEQMMAKTISKILSLLYTLSLPLAIELYTNLQNVKHPPSTAILRAAPL